MKKTPWFSAGEYPVRSGVYEVRSKDKGFNFSYFDGIVFNGCWRSVNTAHGAREWGVGLLPIKWRGLREKT